MMTFISLAGKFALDGVKFAYRVPAHSDTTARILVCFGGRNWEGDKTLRAFGFDAVADRHNLYLISPSFQEWGVVAGRIGLVCIHFACAGWHTQASTNRNRFCRSGAFRLHCKCF